MGVSPPILEHGNHSWIEYVTTLKAVASKPTMTLTLGTWQKGGLMVNYAGDSAVHRTDVASLTVDITATQEVMMLEFANSIKSKGAEAWGYWGPCSDFASDLFWVTTGISLQDWHWLGAGFSDPNVLYDSINSNK